MTTGTIEAEAEEEVEEEDEEEAAAAVISKKQMSFKQDWKAFCVASTSREKSESSAALFKLINNIKLNHDRAEEGVVAEEKVYRMANNCRMEDR
jgi:hypothetical protein